ncbi:hypothetical protein MOV76_35695 [Rhizobium sp. PRIMUS64]|uniref:hypothetical protein n=1 Tax=Rhizobium sp. PRIMUS64 TaxID=2908925 RepID=UPI001FF69E50|nr:hypothetical protein [Rhizobium sp. PRIMUS64]MCJ9696909.1 hypothetical protein [Rhizobium sp. PRIMUS64]
MTKGGRMKVVWPRGKHLKPAPAAELQAIPEQRIRQMVNVIPPRAPKAPATTATDPRMAPAPVTPARLRTLLASMPVLPEMPPIEVTPAQMEALMLLPAMPEDLVSQATAQMTTFGTAVVVVSNPNSEPELLVREQYLSMMKSRKDTTS